MLYFTFRIVWFLVQYPSYADNCYLSNEQETEHCDHLDNNLQLNERKSVSRLSLSLPSEVRNFNEVKE